MMTERGVLVDHATVHRWSIRILPVLAAVLHRHKPPVGMSWRMDETCIKVGGQWEYLYRAVDRTGATIDFLLRAHRGLAAARRFFERAIELHGVPETITSDKSGADKAAIEGMRADSGANIGLRWSKYLDDIVEQYHQAIKKIAQPMMGFKSFRCASILLAGIETMHRIRNEQLDRPEAHASTAASQFHLLAVQASADHRIREASCRYGERAERPNPGMTDERSRPSKRVAPPLSPNIEHPSLCSKA